MNNMKQTLKSQRLLLRPITAGDTDLIVLWRNRDFVKNNFLYREELTPEIHTNWLKTMVSMGKVIQFIIELTDTDKNIPVGSVYLRDIDYDNSSAEFGIFIGEKTALGKGIGTESAKLVLDFAHEQLGLHRIFLRLLTDNMVAYKSYRKVGFVVEGIFRDMKKIDGKFRDIIFMSSIRN